VLLSRLPLRIATALDLHVLGLPPAFALSQDQTLKLDEIDSGRSHVLTRSTTPTDFSTGAMYLKTSTAKVSSMTVSLAETAKPFQAKPPPFAKAVRKDSAVHVSLSSDSLVKHPGTLRLRRSLGILRPKPECQTPHIRRGDANMATTEWPDGRSPCEQ
jgi:hypothetical protein